MNPIPSIFQGPRCVLDVPTWRLWKLFDVQPCQRSLTEFAPLPGLYLLSIPHQRDTKDFISTSRSTPLSELPNLGLGLRIRKTMLCLLHDPIFSTGSITVYRKPSREYASKLRTNRHPSRKHTWHTATVIFEVLFVCSVLGREVMDVIGLSKWPADAPSEPSVIPSRGGVDDTLPRSYMEGAVRSEMLEHM